MALAFYPLLLLTKHITESLVYMEDGKSDYLDPHHRRQPVAEAFNEWIMNFKSLHWIPWRTRKDLRSIEVEPRKEYLEEMAQSELTRYARAAENNTYWCMRNMFECCGWPDAFRGDEFERKRQEWEAERLSI